MRSIKQVNEWIEEKEEKEKEFKAIIEGIIVCLLLIGFGMLIGYLTWGGGLTEIIQSPLNTT